MFGMGWQELLLVLFIALLFFGPKKLPDLGRSFGKAISAFKKGIKEGETDSESDAPPPADPSPEPPKK
ncbi:MAG: twin-arginine translocase TatA/TatE family subunit [Elusimicrobia bacterium]|jgi:sec-independent protein translocase protein TatA|nr:twin-arginine translocase TatA/TatE family subunit [Elusimicrobiota bacterium]